MHCEPLALLAEPAEESTVGGVAVRGAIVDASSFTTVLDKQNKARDDGQDQDGERHPEPGEVGGGVP